MSQDCANSLYFTDTNKPFRFNTLQAEIAGVDIVFTPDGTPVILEVNAVPGWRGLAGVTGIDIGLEVTRYLADRIHALL